MTEHADFIDDLNSFASSLADRISSQELADVRHLIDHNEAGEAILALAWILREHKMAPQSGVVNELRDLADGLVDSPELERALNHSVGQ